MRLILFIVYAGILACLTAPSQANSWQSAIPPLEPYDDIHIRDIQTVESTDGTLWRMTTPPFLSHKYVYLERFDPSTGALKNESLYAFTYSGFSGAGGFGNRGYFVLIQAPNGRAIFSYDGEDRNINPDLSVDRNVNTTLFQYSARYNYVNFTDRTDVFDSTTGQLERSIPMPPRLRLPNARTLATTASEVFTSEIYETLSEVVVWVRAFDKVDGRELWRKRYSHANQAIITTALNASISIDLLAQGGILGYTLRNTRDGKTLIATAALDAVNGNVLWQNARTADAASFANFSWRTLPTTGGNFIFIDTSSSQVQTLFNRTGNIIRLLSNAGRYPIDGESFIVYEGKRFRREAEVSGEVLWQTPHLGDEFNWSRLWCMRDNKAYISSSIGDKENVGYIDLNSAAVVMNETPNFPGYWAAISSTGAPYWPKCLGEFNFTIEYISNQGPRFALGFDGLGNQLWRKSHSNIFIRHRIFSGAHYPVDLLEHPDPYLPQSVTFSGRIDAKGESRGYSGSFNKFEGASFKVIAGTPVETNIRIYERRTDQASSFELISLPPIEQRPIVELQVAELNIELIDPIQLKYQVRVKNAGTHPAMGVRVVADTGLYAEIDLPTANSFVDFEFVRNRFANIGKISAVPAYDVLEANPYDNILVLRPDVHDGFE